MDKSNKELVIRVYDENGMPIEEKILKVFRKYVLSNLKKGDF